MTDINNILSYLSIDDTRNIKRIIAIKISEKICPICQGPIKLPVSLINPTIYCNDCGDTSSAIACLRCVRNWLKLDIEPNLRGYTNHLICRNKQINLRNLNAAKSYKIDRELINLLDEITPMNINCECGMILPSRNDYWTHICSNKCSISIFKCRFCSFRGNSDEIFNHMIRSPYDGGCYDLNEAAKNYNSY